MPSAAPRTSASSATACEDFAAGHLLQSFSLVGTRGDADLMLVSETKNLDRIHEFHIVLAQSGLMQWASQPYSFLGLRKGSGTRTSSGSSRARSAAATSSSTRS